MSSGPPRDLLDELRLHLERLGAEGVWGLAVPRGSRLRAGTNGDPGPAADRSASRPPGAAEGGADLRTEADGPSPPEEEQPSRDDGSRPAEKPPTSDESPSPETPSSPERRDSPGGRSPSERPTVAAGDAGGLRPELQGALFSPSGGGGPGNPWPDEDETLEEVEEEASGCTLCRLCEERTQVVFGVGDPDADLIFIGEAPGRDEDLQGEPFVGRAGKLLTKIIEAMGLRREDVYITNANKCRPPNNRNPRADEIEACRPYLLRQLGLIRPKVIVLLGRVSVESVLGLTAPLSKLRGQFQDWNGVPVMCTYHPAYLLRNPNAKKYVWEDMQLVMALLDEEG